VTRVRYLVPALLLCGFGLLAVYSASTPGTAAGGGGAMWFVRKQTIWVVVALLAGFVVASQPLDRIARWTPFLFFGLLGLLVAMKVFGFAEVRNGAARWLQVGPFTVQPSEFARPIFVLYLAKVLSAEIFYRTPERAPYGGVLGLGTLLAGAVAVQPDFGGAVLLMLVLCTMLFIQGAPLKLLAGFASVGVVVAIEMILASPYKRGRLLAFLDPWADQQHYGFQLVQSYLALGNGGLFGRGLGLGTQKLFYLPEAHTDFIASVIGEELGYVGLLVLIMLFVWLFWEMLAVAKRAPQGSLAQLTVAGVLTFLSGATLFNVAVVTGLVPPKGLALPLVSYGGSALVATGLSLGLVCAAERSLEASSWRT